MCFLLKRGAEQMSSFRLGELAQEGETEEVVKKIESAIDIRKIQFGIDREEVTYSRSYKYW